MKKTVLQIAAALFLTLSLTGCSQLLSDAVKETERPTGPVYTQGDESQPTGADTPSDAPTEAPTEPAEPVSTGYDEYGFSIWPEGNYLADPKFDTEEFLPDFDVDQNFVQYLAMKGSNICSTEDSIYSFSNTVQNPENTFLMYTDKATGLTMPLCGKPECTHDSEECNAYVGNKVYGLRVYDGKLWMVRQKPMEKPELIRMDPDGNNHQVVSTVNNDMTGLTGTGIMLHRGYAYRAGHVATVVDGQQAWNFKVLAQPLDGGDMITVFDRIEFEPDIFCTFCCAVPAGNDLIIALSYRETSENGEEAYCVEVYKWSSRTRKAQQLYYAKNGEWAIDLNGTTPFYVPGEGILFAVSGEAQPEGIIPYTVIRYSFKTRDFEEVCSFSVPDLIGPGPVILTREHIVVFAMEEADEKRVQIYNYSGELVGQSEPLPVLLMYPLVLGEDDTYIYIQTDDFRGVFEEDVSFIAFSCDDGEIIKIR